VTLTTRFKKKPSREPKTKEER